MVARALRQVRYIAVASPAYLAARGMPQTPAELEGHDRLGFTRVGDHFELTVG